jgi:serine/threonine protein kinase
MTAHKQKNIPPKTGMIIADKYQLMKKIGAGSFGFVFSARSKDSKSSPTFGVKFEKQDCDQKVLHIELNALNYMQGFLHYCLYFYLIALGNLHFTPLYYFGHYNNYAFMVMELLGCSLLFGS